MAEIFKVFFNSAFIKDDTHFHPIIDYVLTSIANANKRQLFDNFKFHSSILALFLLYRDLAGPISY